MTVSQPVILAIVLSKLGSLLGCFSAVATAAAGILRSIAFDLKNGGM